MKQETVLITGFCVSVILISIGVVLYGGLGPALIVLGIGVAIVAMIYTLIGR